MCLVKRRSSPLRKEKRGYKDGGATSRYPKEPANKSPLTRRVREPRIPRDLREFPSSQLFSGIGNPSHHITHFTIMMRTRSIHKSMYCQAFPYSLKGSAKEWFENLRPNSIGSWEQLSDTFVAHFTLQPSQVLEKIRQEGKETLVQYLERVGSEAWRFENLSEKEMLFWLKKGLRKGSPFHAAANIKNPETLEALHDLSLKYIKFEEDLACQASAETPVEEQPHRKSQEGMSPCYANYTRLNKTRARILEECKGTKSLHVMEPKTPVVRGYHHPARKWCRYHMSGGHETNQCQRLRDDIESLIRDGKLKQYVEEKEVPTASRKRFRSPPGENPGHLGGVTTPAVE